MAEQKYVRAVRGGTGEAKSAGNYGGSLLPAQLAQEKGFDQVMWLDPHEFRYVQEVGTMNIFFVIGNEVITPPTDGAILKGITRDSIITLLREKGYTVNERSVSVEELREAHRAGKLYEAFGTGTAAVVAHVSEIGIGDELLELPPMEERHIGELAKQTINKMRAGVLEDNHGWIVPVELPEEAMVMD